jgi:hypothetical protein
MNPAMTLISYRGRAAAMAARERFYLAPHIARRPDGDPSRRSGFALAYPATLPG